MGGIGFKFVMFRFYGSEKLTLRKSLSCYKKRDYTAVAKVSILMEVG